MDNPRVDEMALVFFDIPNVEDITADAARAVDKWKIDPIRTRKALVLISYGKVRQAHYGLHPQFDVKSFTPGISYTVDPENHWCECPDSTKGKIICKHRIAVYLYMQRLKRSKEKAAKEKNLLNDLGF